MNPDAQHDQHLNHTQHDQAYMVLLHSAGVKNVQKYVPILFQAH